MTKNEKLFLIGNVLNLEGNTLQADTELSQLEEWDSMAILEVIAMMDKHCGKCPDVEQLKQLRFIGDIIDIM